MITWLLQIGIAAALSPPVGWSAQGLETALLDPKDPAKGEIREFTLPGAAPSAKDLVAAMAGAGFSVERFGTEDDGATNLVMGDKLGRARSEVRGQSTTWWVVIVHRNHAHTLDPDALLKAMATPPKALTWGDREVVVGGHDGSPWGEVEGAKTPTDGWISQVDVQAWTQDGAVVGVWEGQSPGRAEPAKLRFRFENTGLLQVQRTTAAGATVLQGRWATRGNLIQLDIEGGGSNLPYHVTPRTLSVPWEGTSISLYKR